MNDSDKFDLDNELAKSIEKLVDEETSVAKAFVDRNNLNKKEETNKSDKKEYESYENNLAKTQIIPDISSHINNNPKEDIEEAINSSEKIYSTTKDNDSDKEKVDNKNQLNKQYRDVKVKKKLDKKSKIIICSVAAAVVAVIIALVIIAVVVNNNKKNSYDFNYSTGIENYNQGKYSEAITYFEQAATYADGKKNIDMKLKMYECYKKNNDTNKAIDILKDVISYDKYNQTAINQLLSYYSSQNDGSSLTEMIKKYTGTEGEQYVKAYVVEPPVASVVAGSYSNDFVVELQASDGSSIYYSLDGNEPTKNSRQYTGAIEIGKGSTTLKAIAFNNIGTASAVTEIKYVVDYKIPDQPEVSPASGTYEAGQMIAVTNLNEGDKAYYTLDGTTPTKSSTEYTGEFAMPECNTVVSVMILSKYGLESSVTKKNYNVAKSVSYTFDEAKDILIGRMKSVGDMKNTTQASNGGTVNLVYYSKKTINDVEMYMMYYDVTLNGKTTRESSFYYGVGLKNGQCYKVSGTEGEYTMSEY